MTVALKDLDTFFDPDLHLPIKGKKYRVPSPDYEGAKTLREIATQGMPPQSQIDLALQALSTALDDMVDDDVPWSMILHAGRTAILHFGVSPDIGETHWGMAHLGRMIDLDEVTAKFAEVQAAKARLAEMVAATNT